MKTLLVNELDHYYVKDQVKRKMFIWQVRHVYMMLKETMREAIRQPTFADGMQVLVHTLGETAIANLPTVRETYMRLREENGDDTVKVGRGAGRTHQVDPGFESARFQTFESTSLSKLWFQLSTCTPTSRL